MPTPKANFAAQFYQHPNGTQFIITAGGFGGTSNSPSRLTEVTMYNIDEDSWYTSTDPSFNLPIAGETRDNFQGVMYENVFYVTCLLSDHSIYGFMVNGPDDLTWTKVGEFDIGNRYASAVMCNSFETESDILYYH